MTEDEAQEKVEQAIPSFTIVTIGLEELSNLKEGNKEWERRYEELQDMFQDEHTKTRELKVALEYARKEIERVRNDFSQFSITWNSNFVNMQFLHQQAAKLNSELFVENRRLKNQITSFENFGSIGSQARTIELMEEQLCQLREELGDKIAECKTLKNDYDRVNMKLWKRLLEDG